MSTFFEVLYSRDSEGRNTLTIFTPAGTPEEFLLKEIRGAVYQISWWAGFCIERSIKLNKVILILPIFSKNPHVESFVNHMEGTLKYFNCEFEIQHGMQILFTPQHESSIKDVGLQFEQVIA